MGVPTGNLTGNVTSDTNFVGSQSYYVYLVSLSSVNALMNCLLVIAITVAKLDRDSNRFIFIGDLAFGAFIVGIANVIDGAVNLAQPGINHDNLCTPLTIMNIAGLHEASLNLMALVVDQYVLIAYPLRYQVVFSHKRAWVVSCFLIVIVVGISVATIFLWKHTAGCIYMGNLPTWYHCINFICVIISPLVIVITLQILTIRISRRHMRQIQSSGVCDSTAENSMLQRHWTGVITNALICLALILTWTPITIAFGLTLAFPDFMQSSEFVNSAYYAASIYQMYGIWLPVIYAYRSPEVRGLCSRLKARCKNRQEASRIA